MKQTFTVTVQCISNGYVHTYPDVVQIERGDILE